jgi:hypothetical protein
MKNYKIAARIAAAVALAVAFAAAPGFAQVSMTVTNSATPMVVTQTAPKMIWLKAEVVHADGHSMLVRERGNELALHTFTYSPDLQDAMRRLSEQSGGGFQYGDKIKIQYKQGQTVAFRIKGKPSK